jgi:hypothetical protein
MEPISDARWGVHLGALDDNERRKYFGAVSFTETPISEIHCLLHIRYRRVNLEPYGLVFLKVRLSERGVSPVWYIKNEPGDKDGVIRALCSLIDTKPSAAKKMLP